MIVGEIVCRLLQLYLIVLLVRVVLSWVPSLPDPLRPLARGVQAITEPVVAPLRQVLPPAQIGNVALDLSFIVVFLLISVLQSLLCR